MTTNDDDAEASTKTCFVIAPIGKSGTDVRLRSNQILKHVIRPVTEQHGYKTQRADEIDQSGSITSQIIEHVLTDDLIVADLTGQNPNVFYELALRHAVGKPFVHLIASDEDAPFDVRDLRTIQLDYRDLDSASNAREQLDRFIRSVESGDPIETPVSYAVNLQALRESPDPENKGIADLLERMSAMENIIARLAKQLERDTSESHSSSQPFTPDQPPRRRRIGLESMLLSELQALASTLGIVGTARMRKSELIAAVEARQRAYPQQDQVASRV
jgi:hypothetical protein